MADEYANVTLAHKIHSDRRYDLMAEIAGWSRWEAVGRMSALFARCTALQTDRPSPEVIRVHLGLRGEQLLVESTLGERCEDGVIRVKGGGLTGGDTDRFSWYEPVREQQSKAGTKRAKTAIRGPGGRFGSGTARSGAGPALTSGSRVAGPAESSGSPAATSGPPASGFRISEEDQNSLSRAIPQSVPQPEPTPAAMPTPPIGALSVTRAELAVELEARAASVPAVSSPAPILPSSVARADAKRQLIGWAWQLAGDTFRELGREGIEPGAFDPWAGTPNAGDEGMKLLIAHVDRLLIGEPPDVDRARAVFERRIAVAKAEGRAASPPTRRWITPMRLWNAESFAKGAETSPEQVRPRTPAPRRGDPVPPAPAPQRPERPPPDPVISPEERAERAEMARRLATNPDAAAAAELQRGRIPAHMSTVELHKRFGDGQRAPPQGAFPDDDTPPDKHRRRKAAT